MFHEITVSDLSFNPFTRLNKDWALVTDTDPDTGKVNSMTVSWGGVGVLWNKNVVTIYIRPQRYTHEFLEKTDRFTLSFYDMEAEGMRQALTVCGRKSGRDLDKIAEAGLHLTGEKDYPWFEESQLVFCCKTLYRSAFDPSRISDDIKASAYPGEDYHDVYIAEIEKIVKKD